jgi:hypothetical protein
MDAAAELTEALHKAGFYALATEQDYKEAPGPPVVEVMFSQAEARQLALLLRWADDTRHYIHDYLKQAGLTR